MTLYWRVLLPKLTRCIYCLLAPARGPIVRTKKVGKNEAVLEWDQLPVDDQNGFIRNYSISYRTIVGNEIGNKIVAITKDLLLELFLQLLNTGFSHNVSYSI